MQDEAVFLLTADEKSKLLPTSLSKKILKPVTFK